MSEVRSVHLQLKTSTFSILDKSEKHFRKNMSAKTVGLDATKIEKISRTDNTLQWGYCIINIGKVFAVKM